MKSRILAGLAMACLIVGFCTSASAEWTAHTWESLEPPVPDHAFMDYEDATGAALCEIHEVTATYNLNNDSKWNVKIYTNFGANRGTAVYGDAMQNQLDGSANDYFTAQECVAGDLYVNFFDGTNRTVLGIITEDHDSTNAKWNARMEYLYGTDYTLSDLGEGEIYKVYDSTAGDPNVGWFATGTYEAYPDVLPAAEPAVPSMETIRALEGVKYTAAEVAEIAAYESTGNKINANLNPTNVISGVELTDTASVSWVPTTGTDWKGYWEISGFALSGFDPEDDAMNVNFTWSMMCGNDLALVDTNTGSTSFEIPLPSSLLLCGIGAGFAGLAAAVRRRFRRS